MRNVLSIASSVFVFLLVSPALADDGCDDIRKLMPSDFNNYEVVSCETDGIPQTRAKLTLIVPVEDVIDLSTRLTRDFGMGELVFLCCGYEPTGGQLGGFEVPEGVIAPPPIGAFTHFTIGMSAPGLAQEDTDEATEFLPLGGAPAILTLSIQDI